MKALLSIVLFTFFAHFKLLRYRLSHTFALIECTYEVRRCCFIKDLGVKIIGEKFWCPQKMSTCRTFVFLCFKDYGSAQLCTMLPKKWKKQLLEEDCTYTLLHRQTFAQNFSRSVIFSSKVDTRNTWLAQRQKPPDPLQFSKDVRKTSFSYTLIPLPSYSLASVSAVSFGLKVSSACYQLMSIRSYGSIVLWRYFFESNFIW